ncbi:MAG: hypothetical protein ACOX7F_02545 [Eubacteriales bacterium]
MKKAHKKKKSYPMGESLARERLRCGPVYTTGAISDVEKVDARTGVGKPTQEAVEALRRWDREHQM